MLLLHRPISHFVSQYMRKFPYLHKENLQKGNSIDEIQPFLLHCPDILEISWVIVKYTQACTGSKEP